MIKRYIEVTDGERAPLTEGIVYMQEGKLWVTHVCGCGGFAFAVSECDETTKLQANVIMVERVLHTRKLGNY